MEIAAIFGKKRMDACAAIHSKLLASLEQNVSSSTRADRSFVTNVPSVLDPEYTTLHRLVHSLNPRIFKENTPTDQVYHDLEWYNNTRQLYHAIDLLRKTLALDCTKRITARDALLHPFLSATYPDSGDSE
jgi:serine/threonine protein kinase